MKYTGAMKKSLRITGRFSKRRTYVEAVLRYANMGLTVYEIKRLVGSSKTAIEAVIKAEIDNEGADNG